jgi:hypothetical protein
LTRDAQRELESFIDARRTAWERSAVSQGAILATFLQENLGWDGIDADDLYTVYSVMAWPPPNTRSQITNARQRNGYFGANVSGKTQLTLAGERFGKHGSRDDGA